MNKAGGVQQPQHLDMIIGSIDFMDEEMKKHAKDALKHRLLADQRESQARIAKAEFETEKINSERKEFRDKRHADNVKKSEVPPPLKSNMRPPPGKHQAHSQRPPPRPPPAKPEEPKDKLTEQSEKYVDALFDGKPMPQPVLHREEVKPEEKKPEQKVEPLKGGIKGLDKLRDLKLPSMELEAAPA